MNQDKALVTLANSEHFFVQANNLIEAKSLEALSFLEKIIFSKMCTMIDPNDTDFLDYKIFVKDILDLTGSGDSGKSYQNIIEASRKLRTRSITILVKDPITGIAETLETNLVTSLKQRAVASKDPSDMYVKLSFYPELKPYLLQLKNNFTLLDIRNFVRLHSGSTMRIYELLKQYENTKNRQRDIHLETLKSMLGVANKYALYGSFKQKVLDEAQRRINQDTDITFTYEEIKIAKRVEVIRFKIERKISQEPVLLNTNDVPPPPQEESVLNEPKNEEKNDIFFNEMFVVVQPWGITPSTLLKLIENYSPDKIRAAARLTQTNEQQKKIQTNCAGFFIQALKEGFQDPKTTAELQREERRKKATEKQQKQETREQKTIEQKNLLVQRQIAIALQLIKDEPALIPPALFKLNTTIVGRTLYNESATLEENLKSPLLLSAFVSAVMLLRPENFERVSGE